MSRESLWDYTQRINVLERAGTGATGSRLDVPEMTGPHTCKRRAETIKPGNACKLIASPSRHVFGRDSDFCSGPCRGG